MMVKIKNLTANSLTEGWSYGIMVHVLFIIFLNISRVKSLDIINLLSSFTPVTIDTVVSNKRNQNYQQIHTEICKSR